MTVVIKRHLLVIFSLFFVGEAAAQTVQQAADTLAFRQYLSQGTIGDYIHASTLATIYYGLERQEIPSHSGYNYDFGHSDSYYENYTYITSPTHPSHFVHDDNGEFARARFENSTWNEDRGDSRSALRQLRGDVRTYCSSYSDKNAEKRVLVQALTAFDTASTEKPFFFADIKGRFKGDIAKYVDYIYKKSFLTSNRRLKRFIYYANIGDFRADPGVRFVMGLALYELWVRDVREGCVTENNIAKNKE